MINFLSLKNKFPFTLRIYQFLFSVILFLFILYSINWKEFVNGINILSFDYVFLAFLFCSFNTFILGVRWYFLVRLKLHQSFYWHLKHYFKASFFNLITPAAIGSDIYRLLATKKNKDSKNSIAGILLRERVIGLLGYSIFYVICLLGHLIEYNSLKTPTIFKNIGFFFLIFIFFFTFIDKSLKFILRAILKYLPEHWKAQVHQFHYTLDQKSGLESTYLIALTLLSCLTWTMGAYFLTSSFGFPLSFSTIGLICIIAEFARWLPLTPQGVGVRESVFAYGFALVGFPAESGFLIGGVIYILNSFVLLLFAGFSVMEANGRLLLKRS